MNAQPNSVLLPPDRLELGRVGRPHGVGGDVRLFLHNSDSEAIFGLPRLFLSLTDGTWRCCSVRNVKPGSGGKFVIVTLEGVNYRDQAEALTGAVAFADRAELPPLEEGAYYIADLMGMAVYCDGDYLGRCTDSRPQGGIEVITVENDKRSLQVPLVNPFLVKLDFPHRRIDVRLMEGLPEEALD